MVYKGLNGLFLICCYVIKHPELSGSLTQPCSLFPESKLNMEKQHILGTVLPENVRSEKLKESLKLKKALSPELFAAAFYYNNILDYVSCTAHIFVLLFNLFPPFYLLFYLTLSNPI